MQLTHEPATDISITLRIVVHLPKGWEDVAWAESCYPCPRHIYTTHQPFQTQHSSLTFPSRMLVCVVLQTGRGGAQLNNLLVAQEHCSNHWNTDTIPKAKLRSIYLQNTVADYIIPFFRKEMLNYSHRQQNGLASPKLHEWSRRLVQTITWHFAFGITKDTFCPSVFNTALLHHV